MLSLYVFSPAKIQKIRNSATNITKKSLHSQPTTKDTNPMARARALLLGIPFCDFSDFCET